jgi:hypothetical protein
VTMRGILLPSLFSVWILGPLTVCNAFAPLAYSSGNLKTLSVAPQSPSQLYMSNGFFLDRVTRVVKSNVNKWVSNIENPEKVINQAVSEMQVSDTLIFGCSPSCRLLEFGLLCQHTSDRSVTGSSSVCGGGRQPTKNSTTVGSSGTNR